jgi:hypothetical protein
MKREIHETDTDVPPELKGFHTRNMGHAVLVFMIPTLAGAWGLYRQEAHAADDDLQTALAWIFLLGVAAFMVTILIKALVSLPVCPNCHRKMKEIGKIEISSRVLFLKSTSRWRVVDCPECKQRYRIPGLS